MPLPTFIVIPADMGSNIKEGSTVPGSLPADVNHWVAAIHRGTGYNDYIYPNAAVGADSTTAAVNNSDNYVTTPLYVKQYVAAVLAGLPAGTSIQSVAYTAATRMIRITQTDASFFEVVIPKSTNAVEGLVKLLTAPQIALANSDDANAATPKLVAAMIAAAIASLPAAFDTKVQNFTYDSTSRTLTILDNNGGSFNLVLPQATSGLFGLVKLAIASMYPASKTSDTLSATPAFVMAAIADALSGLPGDKFLQGLQSYDAATNSMTLLMNDNSTVTVNMTNLLNDAIASIPDATSAVRGLVKLVIGVAPSASNTAAATPEWVNAAIASAGHAPTALSNTDGVVLITNTGAQAWTINFNMAALPTATGTTRGVVVLATVAEGPVPADDTQAATAAYVENRVNTLVPQATDTVAGKTSLAVAANYPSASDIEAATPAYVAAAVAAGSHAPATLTSSDGTVQITAAGQNFDLKVAGSAGNQTFPMPWEIDFVDNNGTGSSSIRVGFQTIGSGVGPAAYSANPGLGGYVDVSGTKVAQNATGWHEWALTATMVELRTPPITGGNFDFSAGLFIFVDNDTATFTTELNFVGLLIRYVDGGSNNTVLIGPNNFLGGFLPFTYGTNFTQSTLAQMKRPDIQVGVPSNSAGFPVNVFHTGYDVENVIPATATLISSDLVVFWGKSVDSFTGCQQGWSTNGSWYARQAGSKTLTQFLATAN